MDYNPELNDHRLQLADGIVTMLETAEFEREPKKHGKELIYFREIPNKPIRVIIYTSIVDGMVRSVGDDAIRVVAIYTNRNEDTKCVGKAKRVFRTGKMEEIPERILGRMREVWGNANKAKKCHCGAPMVLSKASKLYCAETCWLDKETK